MTTKTRPEFKTLRSEERGHAEHGWLNARHSFSFGDYYNPKQMGFRSLRVINQDIIGAGGGFPTHPHRDMEIFTYVLSGALDHIDSMCNQESIRPGQIQLMSAGTGITHSEFNASKTAAASLLQIWITPQNQGLTPSYTEWSPTEAQRDSNMALLISPDGREKSATIHQDAFIYKIKMESGQSITYRLGNNRAAWLQLIYGNLTINNATLKIGDAASTETSGEITITAISESEALFFDLK